MSVLQSLCIIAVLNSMVGANISDRNVPSSYISMIINAHRVLFSESSSSKALQIPSTFLRQLSGNYILETVEEAFNSGVLQNLHSQSVPSAVCLNHSEIFIQGLLREKIWALSMVDAAAKPGSWILGGEINFLGSYEECVRVAAEVDVTGDNNVTQDTTPFFGKYCTAVIPLKPTDAKRPIPGLPTLGIRFGVCVPDSCTGPDVTAILNSLIKYTNTSHRVYLTLCQERTVEYDAKAVVVLFIITLFALTMIVATAFDVLYIQRPKWVAVNPKDVHVVNEEDGTETPASHSINQVQEKSPLVPKEEFSKSDDYEPGVLGKVLLAFSVYTNGKKILDTKVSKDSIQCLHGLRFVSMTWIILGHTIVFGVTLGKNDYTFSKDAFKDWTFQTITNATVSVDTFFALSGLLLTYLVLKEMKKKSGRINWFLFYFHRFWRLTPPYMLVLMVYVPLFRYWGEGPNWPQTGIEYTNCDHWWTNLLYINNLVKPMKICMGWSWYLSCDMQFFILSPLIFVPFFYNVVLGSVSLLVFLLSCLVTSGVLSTVNGYMAGGTNITPSNFTDFYIKPYVRIGPYLIGMATGYVLYRTQCRVKIPKLVNITGWMIATATALAVTYGLQGQFHGHPLTQNTASFYNAVSREAWAVSVCWVVFSCATGHGGFINTLLSWKAIIPLSRLTYCAYLVHPLVICLYLFNGQQLFYFTYVNIAFAFMSYLLAAYGAAFVVSLAFEAPTIGLEKVLLRRRNT